MEAVSQDGGGPEGALAESLRAATSIGEACQVVADHLVRDGYPLPSVYLERNGRLRCYGINGYWQLYDGIPPGVGVIGRTFLRGEPTVVRHATGHSDYVAVVEGVVDEVCVPIRCGDRVVGALNVEGQVPLPAHALDDLLAAADLLGARLPQVWAPEEDSPMRRLAHHALRVAESTHQAQSVERVVAAACDLAGTSSAMLALRVDDEGTERWHVAGVEGDLAPALTALGEDGLHVLAGWIAPGMSFFTRGSEAGEGSLGGVEHLRTHGVGSFVVVPLDAAGGRIGLLLAADARIDRPSTGTIERLELLSALAAASLRAHQALDDVRQLASRDALTGLGHHGSFHSDLDRAVESPAADGPCVVLLDLDHFKDVNDLHGHPAGDSALRRTAAVLTSQLRGGDRAYRIGGDEFAVLLRAPGADGAVAAVERLHAALTAALDPQTVSIGYAQRCPGEDATMLVARADAALYSVKRSGRADVRAAHGPHAPQPG